MLYAQQSRGVRLGVDFEADALISARGAGAYEAACARAREASSEEMVRDWSDVAAAIARRTRRRSGLVAFLLH